jgi:hypothetical protein
MLPARLNQFGCIAPEEVYPAELRGNMLIEIELKIFRFDIRDNILMEKPD